jgi:hypothetical protein
MAAPALVDGVLAGARHQLGAVLRGIARAVEAEPAAMRLEDVLAIDLRAHRSFGARPRAQRMTLLRALSTISALVNGARGGLWRAAFAL